MFVQTKDGAVPMNRIVRANINWTTGRVAIVYGFGASTDTTSCNLTQWQAALRETVQAMLPAAPETEILSPWLDDQGTFGVTRTTVIGWAQAADGKFYPVTANGVNDGVDDMPEAAIVVAGGEVVRTDDQQWATYAAWAQEEEERLRRSVQQGGEAQTPPSPAPVADTSDQGETA